jgi:hypothetical protein
LPLPHAGSPVWDETGSWLSVGGAGSGFMAKTEKKQAYESVAEGPCDAFILPQTTAFFHSESRP